MQRLNKAVELVAEWLALVGGLVVVVLMLMISLDALGRKTFGTLPGALEFSEALVVPAVFLPLMFVQVKRENVFVSVTTAWMSPRAQAFIDGIAAVVGILVMGLLTWLALNSAIASFAIREYRVALIDVPIWPFRWIIPIGTGFLVFQLVLSAIEDFSRAFGEEEPPPLDFVDPHLPPHG